jgi:hypothetical protein
MNERSERAQRVSHANGARRRSGARERVSGSPRGEAPRMNEEYAREKPMRIKFQVEYDGPPPVSE